ncbi:hypothetical protein [Virgisporangium aurantiacum]|uniref:hypothetical protein n=1 Tax=Virgisporangium aurantiacum TaxID=175570 RepID=UPI001EF271B1|nr:hypothetical protein [Virgisporangium aurantiacum]
MRPDGLPIWTSDAMPGHLYDLTCAQYLDITGALYWAASTLDLSTLGDSGYDGTGQGIHTPVQTARRRPTARRRRPCPQPAAALDALPRRTRLRHPHRTLADTAPHHRQPSRTRRPRRRSAASDPLRIPVPTAMSLRSRQ